MQKTRYAKSDEDAKFTCRSRDGFVFSIALCKYYEVGGDLVVKVVDIVLSVEHT